ncbi:MAG: AAA family ATPase, partial [Nitrospinota bacterium]
MNKGLFDDVGKDGKTEKNAKHKTPPGSAPLAERMRPRTFNNFVGQSHVVGEKKPLRRLIEEDTFGSLLLWGPPGSGKTTLAEIATGVSGRRMFKLSAVESGVKELKEVIKAARYNADSGKKNVLFIDEIHRYSKVQQDALLPHVESGLVTLIGATTENPSFGVIPALRSRCQVVELTPLSFDEIKEIVKSA